MAAPDQPSHHQRCAQERSTARVNADVLVIGAGPAGSAAACAIARRGLRVVLVDKADSPRDKVCGDALIPDALNALQSLSLKDRVLSEATILNCIRIYAPDRSYVLLNGYFACISRLVLDDLLRHAAVESGARVFAPYKALRPIVEADMVKGAILENQAGGEQLEVTAPMTLLATGAGAEPLFAFGVCQRSQPSAMAVRIYVTSDDEVRREFDYLCISYDRTICPGYGWIFPGPGNVFNVGVGIFHDSRVASGNLRTVLDTFLRTFPPAKRLLDRSRSTTSVKGAPLRTALRGSRLSRPGLLVIGEAAGLTYSASGEGIGKAIESGLMAAAIVSDALSGSASDAPAAAHEYERQLVATFRDRFRAYEVAQQWLAYPTFLNFIAWRARSGKYVRSQLEGLIAETCDPKALFSRRGLFRSLWQ